MAENFPNFPGEKDLQIQEAKQMLNRINLKKSIPRHNIIKLLKTKNKEKILKAAREK